MLTDESSVAEIVNRLAVRRGCASATPGDGTLIEAEPEKLFPTLS